MIRSMLAVTCIAMVVASPMAKANETIQMYRVDKSGQGMLIGTVTLSAAKCGVLLTPNLQHLPSGVHGFHVHEKPSCADLGMAAGAHLDPSNTQHHEGPYQEGHLGDLPVLVVDANGKATLPVLAPRVTLASFKGHALMIHANGDNYADQPEKLGGGGERIACGVIN